MMMQVCVAAERKGPVCLVGHITPVAAHIAYFSPDDHQPLNAPPFISFKKKKFNLLKAKIFPSLVLCCEAFGFCGGTQNEFRTR